MTEHLDIREGYDLWAEIYDGELNPLVHLEEPLVRGWLASVAGLKVADVGCGTGRHTAWLAQAGAGVDAYETSPGMLAKAKAKLVGRSVHFIQHQLPNPMPVESETYDVALFALVADHLADLNGAFCELHRILKPGGSLIFTVLHPAMNLRGINDRCRKVKVAKVTMDVLGDWANVQVIWVDGSWASVRFASAAVAKKYINTKRFQP